MIQSGTNKTCNKCFEVKELEMFRTTPSKEHRRNTCRKCEHKEKEIKRTPEQEKRRRQRREYSIGRRWKSLKKGVLIRNIEVLITKEEFASIVKDSICFYCESEIGRTTGSAVDRINSSRPYELNNVVNCCKLCNHLKMAYSKEELLNHIPKFLKGLEKLPNERMG